MRAAEHLRRGDFVGAFRFADRLCRVTPATALDFLLRSEAARGAGLDDRAAADLARALDLDPTQRTVLRFVLQWGGAAGEAGGGARADRRSRRRPRPLAPRGRGNVRGRRGGLAAAAPGRRASGGLGGFSRGTCPRCRRAARRNRGAPPLAADPQHVLRQEGLDAANLTLDPAGLRGVRLMDGDREIASWSPPPEPPPLPRAPQTAKLWIVVPVYEDLAATRACLNAAMAQLDDDMRLVVIDDASPNAALRGWLDVIAASGRLELIRNPKNLGFAASVNRALKLCLGGDVILLNADALPPRGVFARLAELARAAPDVGALTPLSNNGETCSFPVAQRRQPAAGRGRDRASRRAGAAGQRRPADRPAQRHRLLSLHHPRLSRRDGTAAGNLWSRLLRGRGILSQGPRTRFSNRLRRGRLCRPCRFAVVRRRKARAGDAQHEPARRPFSASRGGMRRLLARRSAAPGAGRDRKTGPAAPAVPSHRRGAGRQRAGGAGSWRAHWKPTARRPRPCSASTTPSNKRRGCGRRKAARRSRWSST